MSQTESDQPALDQPTGAAGESPGGDPVGPPTLRYRVGVLALAGDDPTTVLPPGVERVLIEADVVTIEGVVRWPGCAVQISCRELRAVGSEPAVLDVSGGSPHPSYPSEDRAAPGQPGRPGASGRDGGAVTISAHRVDGDLEIRSNGGAGGDGQAGGHGIRPPAPRAAKDGSFTKKTKYGLSWWKSSGPYGGKVYVTPAAGRAYVAAAWGQRGARGATGRPAGPSGQPGNGGTGGRIVIRLSDETATSPRVVAAGGPPGQPGPPAKAGAGGPGGAGGRNRIYRYSWPKTREGFTNANDKKLREAARDFGISHRAATGGAGAPGPVPASPTAEPGQPTDSSIEVEGPEVLGAGLGTDLLALVLALVERDRAAGHRGHGGPDGNETEDQDLARARLRWLVAMTAARGDAEGRRIHQDAAARLTAMADEETTVG